MNNTLYTNNTKRGRGRPPKDSASKPSGNKNNAELSGIPTYLEPSNHDIHDELARMDSYIYSQYNE